MSRRADGRKGKTKQRCQSRAKRLTAEQIRHRRDCKREAQEALRERQKAAGLEPRLPPSIPNRTCEYRSVDEEKAARQNVVLEQLKVMRTQLPVLLARLGKITDPRNPKKLKHQLTLMLVYGILIFVYHMSSRREANRTMTRPMFTDNLRLLFPELDKLPHLDTLGRLLSSIDDDVSEIEQTHVELIRRLIRKKKFHRYLVQECYPIAIDASGKLSRYELLSEQWQQREVGKGDSAKTQYYVSVLEANLAFHNGMVIPLLSEFLDYTQGDTSNDKQDCEQRAFHRLAARLKHEFPRLPIIVLLDGLYPNGPIMATCNKYNWQFMIVLQDDSLPSVWEEYYGLLKLEPGNCYQRAWGQRRQSFQWINDIEYCYGPNERKSLTLHVVTCSEKWEEIDDNANTVLKTSRHAWISSKPLKKSNLHQRCNLAARFRWGIEAGFLVEKHHGYQYQHCFSHNWNVMRGFHFLMRIGHMFNVLAQFSSSLVHTVRRLGVRGFISFLTTTMQGPWLNAEHVRASLAGPAQLRLE